jgi:hypothetical protein
MSRFDGAAQSALPAEAYRNAAEGFLALCGEHWTIYLDPVEGSHQKRGRTSRRPLSPELCLAAWQGERGEVGFMLRAPRFVVLDLDPAEPGAVLGPRQIRRAAAQLAARIGAGVEVLGHYTIRGAHLLVFPRGPESAARALELDGVVVAGCQVESLTRGRLPGLGGRGGFALEHTEARVRQMQLDHAGLISGLARLDQMALLNASVYEGLRESHSRRTIQGTKGVSGPDLPTLVEVFKSMPLERGRTFAGSGEWGQVASGSSQATLRAAIETVVGDGRAEQYAGIRKERRRGGVAGHLYKLAKRTHQEAAWVPPVRPAEGEVDKLLAYLKPRRIPWANYGISELVLSRYLRPVAAHLVRMVTLKTRDASIGYIAVGVSSGVEVGPAESRNTWGRQTRKVLSVLVRYLGLGARVKRSVRGRHGDIFQLEHVWRTRFRRVLGRRAPDDWARICARPGSWRPGFAVPHAVEDVVLCAQLEAAPYVGTEPASADLAEIRARLDRERQAMAPSRNGTAWNPEPRPITQPITQRSHTASLECMSSCQ